MPASILVRPSRWRRWLIAATARIRTIFSLTAHSLWRGVVGIYNSDDLTHAASIAYYALLSLFPFLLLLMSVVGSVATSEEARQWVIGFALDYFPTRLEFLTRQIDSLSTSRVQLGLASGLALTWASLGFFSAISTAVNHAWGVEKQRSYLKHKLVAFMMMLAAGGMLLLTLLLFSAGQVVEARWFAAVRGQYPALGVLQGFALQNATMLMLIAGLGFVFYFIPNAKVRFRDVWVGAVLTGVLWRGAFEGFSWYVRDQRGFSVHGSIAAVVVFLVWVYTSAVILLYGVEFTAAYGRLRRRRPEQVPAAPPRVG